MANLTRLCEIKLKIDKSMLCENWPNFAHQIKEIYHF